MLKKIFLLCFLLSGFIFTQQYTNEKYEKYIGTKLGKYPLTVTGLKKAISALDSGVVYISYPGLWDTTGLGAIPAKVGLQGYLFGSMVYQLPVDVTNTFNKYYWNDGTGPLRADIIADGIGEISYSPFSFASRTETYWSTVSIYNVLDKYSRIVKQSGSIIRPLDVKTVIDTSFKGGLESIPHVQGIQSHLVFRPDSGTTIKEWKSITSLSSQIDYLQRLQSKKLWVISGMSNKLNLLEGSDTISTYSMVRCYGAEIASGSTLKFDTDVIGYYSNMSSIISGNLLSGKYAYHFYGYGNYPIWNQGSVNSGGGYNYSSDTSSTDDYKIALAGAHTLIAGLEVTFKAVTANTDDATLTVNSLTAKAITKSVLGSIDNPLNTGDILAGQIVKAVYDGTQFQIISRLAQ
jgi:hypothetical protein